MEKVKMNTVIVKSGNNIYIGKLFWARWCGDGYAVELLFCYQLTGEEFPIYFERKHFPICEKLKLVDDKFFDSIIDL